MPTLTLEAIRENPWNAVTRNLPLSPSRLLLAAARFAADYCRMSEYLFVNAARSGRYVPPEWRPGPESADAHEESEARGDAAARRHDEIDALYERIFGELLD